MREVITLDLSDDEAARFAYSTTVLKTAYADLDTAAAWCRARGAGATAPAPLARHASGSHHR